MRKFGAFLAVAVAAAVIGPSALAATKTQAVTHHVEFVKHMVRHDGHTLTANVVQEHPALASLATSTCPPGQTGGSYCVGPPVPDTLYETISINGTASIPVTTHADDTLLVAFVQSDGPKTGGQSSTVSGGGLTWHKAAAENKGLGDSEVWYALLPAFSTAAARETITATAAIRPFDENLTIVSFENASGIGATGGFFSAKGAPSGTITTTQANSWVWASGNDWGGAAIRRAGPGQTAVVQALDLTARKTFWTQTTNSPTTNAGTAVTINDTAPTADPFNLVLAEVL